CNARLNFLSHQAALGIKRRPMLLLIIKKIPRAFFHSIWMNLRRLIFRPRLASAKMVEANVRYDAIEPGIEAAFETEAVQIAVDLEEGFLINVARVFGALHQVQRQPQHIPVVAANQLLKSGTVACLSLSYKCPLV